MNKAVKILFIVAVIGFGLSLFVHISSLTGIWNPLGMYSMGLHLGIFIVHIPAVFISMKLTRGKSRKDYWKIVLEGCPSWMRYLLYAFFAYAVVNFILRFLIFKNTEGDDSSISMLAGFSGHWMVFYGAALAIYYAHIQRNIRKCPNGHIVSKDTDYCDECGTKIEP